MPDIKVDNYFESVEMYWDTMCSLGKNTVFGRKNTMTELKTQTHGLVCGKYSTLIYIFLKPK